MKILLLALKKQNKAFFMPTVMVYTLILISFVSWQTYTTLNLYKVVNNYEQIIYLESALAQIQDTNSRAFKSNSHSDCINTTPYVQNISNEYYEVKSTSYCFRNPKDPEVLPGAKKIIDEIEILKKADNILTIEEYDELIMTIEEIQKEEKKNDWIGIDPNLLSTKVDTATALAISAMEIIYIISNEIYIGNSQYNLMIISSADDKEIKKVIIGK